MLDLVSPWLAAVEATDSPLLPAFQHRHAILLESLQRQRAPLADAPLLTTDRELLHALAARASASATQRELAATTAAAADAGANAPAQLVLVPGSGTGDSCEVIPGPKAVIALFLDRAPDNAALCVTLARALAANTRWCSAGSASPVRTAIVGREWDRWALAGEIPLREWLYAEGLGVHLAARLFPDVAPHCLLDISQSEFRRLRERERALHALISGDLDGAGVGLLLRWMAPWAPRAARLVGDTPVPPSAGRYLAWRMTAERVERVGLREAMLGES